MSPSPVVALLKIKIKIFEVLKSTKKLNLLVVLSIQKSKVILRQCEALIGLIGEFDKTRLVMQRVHGTNIIALCNACSRDNFRMRKRQPKTSPHFPFSTVL